ncbi:MAG: XdhC family protein [Thalassotalea sp.]|nr:XdhC family protein [Thalassotalea sp.]
MQENWLELSAAFDEKQDFVLAVITETHGATYRKAGTMMLVSRDKECTGLLSGGCLEADIALHAESVFENKVPAMLHYDLTTDADLLWGLGLGCEGKIDILLQPLLAESGHCDFANMLSSVCEGKTGRYWLPIPASATDTVNPSIVVTGTFQHEIASLIPPTVESHAPVNELANGLASWLSIPITPPISLAVIGAGPDAVPVVDLALNMGWRVNLFDHRDNALNRSEFSREVNTVKMRAEQAVAECFDTIDAAVVMTHNLAFDQAYLSVLLSTSIDYIGLLGPMARRDKMLTALEQAYEPLSERIFGPVGLDIGGRSPQAIALSIAAQIQQKFARRYEEYRAVLVSAESD